jgi:hypothetical protein
MTQVLEDRLRRVLAAEAERGPAPTATVADLEPHPAAKRRARWVLVGAGAAAAAVASLAIGLTSGGSSPAFASWTSRPTPTSAMAAVDGSCRTYGRPLLVDRRGHTAYSVYAHDGAWIGCIGVVPGQTPDKGLGPGYVDFGPVDRSVVTAPSTADPLVVLDAKSPEGSAPQKQATVTYVSGRLSSGVARVTVETNRGLIEASVADGVFAAWWPGNDGDTAVVRAYDSSGRLLSTVDELDCTAVDGRNSPRIATAGFAPTGGCR